MVYQVEDCGIGGACSTHGSFKKCIKITVGISEGNKPLDRPRYRLKGYVKMDLKEKGCDEMDCTYLVYERDRWRALENTVIIFGFHKREGIS
jgi:hypothetical protein